MMRYLVATFRWCLTLSLAATLSALESTPASAVTGTSLSACAQTVREFYSWHLSHPGDYKAIHSRPELFSSELITLMKADEAAQTRPHDEVGLDFDPYVNAQAFPRSFVLGPATEATGTCRVPVYMQFSGPKRTKPNVVAQLRIQNGRWIFTNFSYGSGSDLIKTLYALRADRAHNRS